MMSFNIQLTGKKGKAIHRLGDVDWHVWVQYTDDPNLVMLMYRKPVKGQEINRMQIRRSAGGELIPRMRAVPPSQLRDLEEFKDGNREDSEH